MSTPADHPQPVALPTRIAVVWIISFVALALAGWIGQLAQDAADLGSQARFLLQAVVMSGIVVPGVWWARRRLDRRPVEGLGVLGLRRSAVHFGLGIGIILIPFLLTVTLGPLAGWATIVIDTSGPALSTLAVGILTAFLFEALPEELAFRGYIFRNLHTRMRTWTAAIATVGLFVLLPVFVTLIQRYLLGMEISVGGSSSITLSYLVIMTLFGCFVQYLRILSGTIWMGVGFHLAFLMINRIMGPRPSDMFYFADIAAATPMVSTAVGSLVLLVIALLAYPRLAGRPLGWSRTAPE